MARAKHVMKAAKDVPGTDIKKGESYYWWKFRYGGKQYSRTSPKRSQLTQSSFYSAVWGIEDDVIPTACADESLASTRDDIVSRLEDLRSDCESSLDNIPESLREGSSGQLLQERIDALESAISEFEDLELEWSAEQGSEVLVEETYEPADEAHAGECKECGETARHTLDCELSVEAESVNDEGQTESEYWEGKLEEFQAISIEAP
jgi:hypothetical protein